MKFETHFLKNVDFKTVQANGVFGGITNNGQINMSFYTDRAPIPKKIILEVDPDTGAVLNEIERDSKEGIIREVHFGILLDKDTARSMVDWLNEKIKTLEH